MKTKLTDEEQKRNPQGGIFFPACDRNRSHGNDTYF